MSCVNSCFRMMVWKKVKEMDKSTIQISSGMELVSSKYGENSDEFGGELVSVDDNGDIIGQDPKKLKYNIDLATLMADLSSFVYLLDPWWDSEKKGKGKAESPVDFSLKCKFWCGQLKQEGLNIDTDALDAASLWNFEPLPKEYDHDFGARRGKTERMGTLRSGMVVEREMDTQAIILVNRRDKYVVLSIRGTVNTRDAKVDADLRMVSNPVGQGKIHRGFKRAYLKLAKGILEPLDTVFRQNDESGQPLYNRLFVTGHSLGAGLATVSSLGLRNILPPRVHISVYTYGSPMVGNKAFCTDYNKRLPDTWRHVNDQDFITVTPPHWMGYRHVNNKVYMNDFGIWIRPTRDEIFVDNSIDAAQDHELFNYKRLLGQYRSVQHIPVEELQAIYEAWVNYINSHGTAIRVMTKAKDQAYKEGGWLTAVRSSTVQSLSFENAANILNSKFSHFNKDVLGLVEVRLREISGNYDVRWSQFLITMYELFYHPRKNVIIRISMLRRKLEQFDADGDNFLTFNEFRGLYFNLFGVNPDDKDLTEQFKKIDLNLDSRLSYNEVLLWLVLNKDIKNVNDFELDEDAGTSTGLHQGLSHTSEVVKMMREYGLREAKARLRIEQ